MPIVVDLHSHSIHSHAKDSVADMVASAYARGLKVYGVSEHSPRPDGFVYPNDYQNKLVAGFPSYVNEVLAEKEHYRGRMDVLLALEMDYMPGHEDYAAHCIAEYPFDYVIGGLHFLGTWGFDWSASEWNDLSSEAKTESFTEYYRALKSMAESRLFHVAAHPDLIKLFSKGSFSDWVATGNAKEYLRDALGAMKDAGMAMEISSAAIRKGLEEPYPCREIMEIARELQVPVSFGSDAHSVDDIASHFDALAAYAKEYGYTQSVVFYQKQRSFRNFS